MIYPLTSYLNSIGGVIKKEDVLEFVNQTIASIDEVTQPLVESFIKDFDKDSIKSSSTLKTISLIARIKDNKTVVKNINDMLLTIIKAERDIKKVIKKNLPDIVVPKSATARDIAILGFINGVSEFSLATADVIYRAVADSDETIEFTKQQNNEFKNVISTYANHLKFYNRGISKHLKLLSDVSTTQLSNDVDNTMLSRVLKKTGIYLDLPQPDDFIGNPIYHIRMWYIDKRVAHYEANKAKKQLLELKLLELKLRSKDSSNSNVNTQIEYFEEKISNIESDIRDFEED